MKIVMLTTSWPTRRRAWAGHFVADLARYLVSAGVDVTVVATVSGRDEILPADGVEVIPVPTSAASRPLRHQPQVLPEVLAKLSSVARGVLSCRAVDVWVTHWWPLAWSSPEPTKTIAVLHGSDVDAYEALPLLLRWLALPPVAMRIAVAAHLADRACALDPSNPVQICPLGAHGREFSPDVLPITVLSRVNHWLHAARPRVLSVGRATPEKGLDVARHASRVCRTADWLVLDSLDGVSPEGIRALLSRTDLLVVPSQKATHGAGEGRPHVMAQAFVAGVPVLCGPNRTLVSLARQFDQFVVLDSGPTALALAVARALANKPRFVAARRRAVSEGQTLRWGATGPRWLEVLESARLA